jgi:hypothetical protein
MYSNYNWRVFYYKQRYNIQLLIPYSGTPLSGVGQQTITAIPHINKVWGIDNVGGLTAIVLDVGGS